MGHEVHRRNGRATPAALREVLDDAVRRLAVGSGDLWERVGAATLTLGRLSREDFPDAGDRRLLESTRLRVMRLDLAIHSPAALDRAQLDAADATLEAIAQDLITLRGRLVARALLDR